MYIKYIGAVLVIVSCGGLGFAMAAAHRTEERQLRQLSQVLQYLSGELQYRLSSLPELCAIVGRDGKGQVYQVFYELGCAMEENNRPDAAQCLYACIQNAELAPSVRDLLYSFGKSLGRFDLSGQLEAITLVGRQCDNTLEKLSLNREDRLRSYQTLGICAGAALVILFV